MWFTGSCVVCPDGSVIHPSSSRVPPWSTPRIAGILQDAAATGVGVGDGEGDGEGDGVADAAADAVADAVGVEVATVVLPLQAHSRINAARAVPRMRGTIARPRGLFAY